MDETTSMNAIQEGGVTTEAPRVLDSEPLDAPCAINALEDVPKERVDDAGPSPDSFPVPEAAEKTSEEKTSEEKGVAPCKRAVPALPDGIALAITCTMGRVHPVSGETRGVWESSTLRDTLLVSGCATSWAEAHAFISEKYATIKDDATLIRHFTLDQLEMGEAKLVQALRDAHVQSVLAFQSKGSPNVAEYVVQPIVLVRMGTKRPRE